MEKVDLDKFTPDEIDSLIRQLSKNGYISTSDNLGKSNAFYGCLKKRGAKTPYVSSDLRNPLFNILDNLFCNKEVKTGRKLKTLPLDLEKRSQYLQMMDDIVEIMFPYYNKVTGFKDNKRYDDGVTKEF